MIPYGRQSIDEDDLRAVEEVLRSDWLTTGPKVGEFEAAVAGFCGAAHGVAVSSGTAALHVAMHALQVGPGDEVIVPPLTFAASANCVLYQGATPVFADVDPETLLLDPAAVEAALTPRTRAVIGVDYAGQPCDWDALAELARPRGLRLVADACHALGAEDKGRRAGTLADLSVFSFHPVKHVATGEGGMVLTDQDDLAANCRVFRNHGITTDHRQREAQGSWLYEMVDLGFNYRLTDIQCALGLSQMRKLERFLARRREIAARYDAAFAAMERVQVPALRPGALHAYHLYVVRVPERARVFAELRRHGLGVNVHYMPVHLHPYYRERLGTGPGLCPHAEAAYEELISLPMFPAMSDAEVETVIRIVGEVV
ncbi:MAG: UDP-4-amino-4,6-dideoxy-N-acetyl-beta-L-altrosamine transaminase [Desulfovibrionaceae bacterium]